MAPYIGILRAAGLAKETTVGTLVTPPTAYVPYIPPDGFSPDIMVLESKGIFSKPDAVYKATQGPGHVKGKIKVELEPENCGDILMGAFGADAVSGSAGAGYAHLMTRLANAQLPSYSWWLDRGAAYAQFVGCMVNKLDIEIKAKEFVTLAAEYVGLAYDATGSSKSPSYSTLHPFRFHQAAINVDSSPVLGYDNLKISVDNKVKAEHALSGSIYTSKIWSEGMRVTISADLYFEDATQYNKFLAGTSAAFNIVITSDQDIPSSTPGTKAKLTLDLPTVLYTAAPLYGPTGVLKVPFAGVAVYNTGSGYTMAATLLNSRSSAY